MHCGSKYIENVHLKFITYVALRVDENFKQFIEQ